MLTVALVGLGAGHRLRGAVSRVAAPEDSVLSSVDYRDGQASGLSAIGIFLFVVLLISGSRRRRDEPFNYWNLSQYPLERLAGSLALRSARERRACWRSVARRTPFMTSLGLDAFEIRFYVLRERRAGEPLAMRQEHYKCRDAIDADDGPARRADHAFEWRNSLLVADAGVTRRRVDDDEGDVVRSCERAGHRHRVRASRLGARLARRASIRSRRSETTEAGHRVSCEQWTTASPRWSASCGTCSLDASGELLLEHHDERLTDGGLDLAIGASSGAQKNRATTAQFAARSRTRAARSRDHWQFVRLNVMT